MLCVHLKRFQNFESKFIKKYLPKNVIVHSFDSTGAYFSFDVDKNKVLQELKNIIKNLNNEYSECYLIGYYKEEDSTLIWILDSKVAISKRVNGNMLNMENLKALYELESTYQAKYTSLKNSNGI